MVTPFSYYDMLDMFQKPGCPICNLLLRDADGYLDSILYEYVTDSDTIYAFRGSRGFCNEHGWQLMNYFGGKQGAALLYQGALDEVLKLMAQQKSSRPLFSRKGNSLAEKLAPVNECVICQMQNRNEKTYVEVFSQHIQDKKLQDAYRKSDGICLPHFRQVLTVCKPPDAEILISIQRDLWKKTYSDVEEFILHSTFVEDSEKWMRVVRQLCGEKGVFGRGR